MSAQADPTLGIFDTNYRAPLTVVELANKHDLVVEVENVDLFYTSATRIFPNARVIHQFRRNREKGYTHVYTIDRVAMEEFMAQMLLAGVDIELKG